MKKRIVARCSTIGAAVVLSVISPAGLSTAVRAGEMSAVEEMLEILRRMDAVDQAKYEELKLKLAAEKEQNRQLAKTVEKPAGTVNVTWKNGPLFTTEDGNFQFDISGRIHNHYGYIAGDDDIEKAFGEGDDFRGFFRRARIGVSGKVYNRLGFKAEYDFAGGDADFADVYLEAYKIPLAGTITVGHFKEPLSVDEMTSTNNNWFIERSQVNEAFYQGRDSGMKIQNLVLDSRLGFALAAMTEVDSAGDGDSGDGDTRLAGRIWGLPLAGEETGDLHLGLSYRHLIVSDETAADATQRYRARPETLVTDLRFVDTGNLSADTTDLLIAEIAWARDRWNVVAEYYYQMVDLETGDDPEFWGAYGLVSYFLTEDRRPYSAASGGFGGVRPNNPVKLEDGGWGAWEVAARYSYLDLDDEAINGGTQGIFTAGVNWYPASMFRLMLDYSLVLVDDRIVNAVKLDGDTAHVIQSRLQVDF